MALAPAVAGFVAGGPTRDSVWLVALWALCYCVQFAAARWLKSRFARRYLMPVAAYGVALVVLGVPFVVIDSGILRWAPIYMVLAALSFLAAWLRRERSLWGNAVAVLASSLMATVVASYGSRNMSDASCVLEVARYDAQGNPMPVPCGTQQMLAIMHEPPTWDTWWSPYAFPAGGLMMSAVFAATQFGSVLFVKTMIRERGSRAYLVASVAWHAVLFAGVTWWIGSFVPAGGVEDGWIPMPLMWTELAAIWLLARSVALPWIGSRRRVKPVVTGMVEMVSTLLVFVAVLTALAAA
ncbi:YwiC-like protein [Bifidobacterium parmae]|uniref:YwiC-like protein n=2 Tax=Bifidobacterium parmae TaxID=361854 RepID=A0A2N5J4D3_9BIFI|nr:YwiC-like protein [Bifidobacterium parmae]